MGIKVTRGVSGPQAGRRGPIHGAPFKRWEQGEVTTAVTRGPARVVQSTRL
ncbi:hypothetical protein GCM10010399_08270 [Dactylosporangium fulvum]|uniref:Uncharacterized protein n=1 Tax=Dactylosporangium fulvum TaxID=53359 RepID=A0ABY5WDR0_9ACTN|nr:hypothetical protein [Dactylosporangium fulvum]UWP86531.1 hypothetical protein Dfulv_20745 [Dactylosporangium fulvum]